MDLHSPDEPSDRTLMRRVTARDQAALKLLYDRYAGRLLAVAQRILGDRSRAEDVLQEAFVSVWNAAATHDDRDGSVFAWLYSITRFKAIDLIRREQRQSALVDAESRDAGRETVVPATQEAALDERRQATRLHDCLGRLGDDTRAMIARAFQYGYSHSEIAEIEGLPLGTIKSRIRRTLIGLRACMEAES